MINWKPKHRNCKACRTRFFTDNPLVTWCSDACCDAIVAAALAKVRASRDKQARKDHRKAREAVKPRSKLVAEAQQAVNECVRERDHDLYCVSCYRTDDEIPEWPTGGKWDAGHYVSVGANATLRFEFDNIHKQCKWCNHHKGGGNNPGYRPELLRRIGADRVAWLEGPHETRHYTRDELIRIKVEARAETRRLRKLREC